MYRTISEVSWQLFSDSLVITFSLQNAGYKHFGILHTILLAPHVTLEPKHSLRSLGYICSKSQKYIVWVKMINFYFKPKIIRILSKDHVPWRYFVNVLP